MFEDQILLFVRNNQRRSSAVIQDIAQFINLCGGVDHHKHATRFQHSKDSHRCFQGIFEMNGYTIAALQSPLEQCLCQAITLQFKFLVSISLLINDQSDFVRILARTVF